LPHGRVNAAFGALLQARCTEHALNCAFRAGAFAYI
jgi:hypothetical protein